MHTMMANYDLHLCQTRRMHIHNNGDFTCDDDDSNSGSDDPKPACSLLPDILMNHAERFPLLTMLVGKSARSSNNAHGCPLLHMTGPGMDLPCKFACTGIRHQLHTTTIIPT